MCNFLRPKAVSGFVATAAYDRCVAKKTASARQQSAFSIRAGRWNRVVDTLKIVLE